MAYIGRGINSGDAVSDHLTGSGATVYTLTYDTTTDGVVLSLDGVVQRNGTDFTILGTQLTFTSAVASPIAIQIIYTGLTLAIGTPGTGTVGVSQLSSTGTASSSTYLRGDNSWATIPATADEITKSSSDPTASTNPAGGVGTLYLNTTSGEMFSLTDATGGANVWTNIGDGTGTVPITYMSGTGGTITTDGSYKVHTFLSSGTFTPTIGNVAAVGDKVEYLVIAGGASGGYSVGGGGGGAGGYLTASSQAVTSTGYTITVGAGGASVGAATIGNSGTNSVFTGIATSNGGGGGGSGSHGVAGGCGGGGAYNSSGSLGGVGSQGFNGGIGRSNTTATGGGGGGTGAVGVSGASGSTGGAGTASSITGSSVTRGGGGGGASETTARGLGGSGGGGNGQDVNVDNGSGGSVNTGSGGGGAYNTTTSGAGGSGVVIIRYQFQA